MSEAERLDVTTSPIDRLDGSTFLSLQDSITNLIYETAYVKLSSEHIRHLSDLLRRLRASLLHDEHFAKESFRSLGGFEAVTGTLQAFSGCYTRCDNVSGIRLDLIDLLTAVVELVSEALSTNILNRRCFGKETHDTAWTDFGEAILATGVLGDSESHEKFFGLLFSLALLDYDLTSLFRRLRLRSDETEGAIDSSDGSTATTSAVLAQTLQSETLWCYKMVPIILKGWKICCDTGANTPLAQHIILALVQMCNASKHNLVAVHDSTVISILLEQLSRSDQGSAVATSTTLLLSSLLRVGLPDLSVARLLLRLAEAHPDLKRLCSEARSMTSSPPAFHFDLRLGGYAAIQFANVGASFPSPQQGYTLSIWLQVESYDIKCHTIVFGLADTFLVYIESGKRNLVLQTSTINKVVFEQFLFEIGVEYHIVIIHNPAQRSTLFVNGVPVDDVQCPYPATMLSPRAFIGTPYDLAALIGHNVLKSRWCLLSLHLFNVPLTPEAIFVYYKLTSRYRGNFQEFSSFFTYSAAADLTMMDERMAHHENSKSSLGEIVRTKRLRSDLVLAVNTSLHFSYDEDESKLLLKTTAATDIMLHHISSTLDGNGYTVNSAAIHLRDKAHLGHLTDGVIAFRPRYWPDTLWQLSGGVSLLLRRIATAKTITMMIQEITAMFEILDCSWRLSEAFERENAYAIMSWLIRVKVGEILLQHDVPHITLLAPQTSCADYMPELLLHILGFVGIDLNNPKSCLIKNMLAYRTLVLDGGLWNQSRYKCQEVFYQQFIVLLSGNRFSAFNAKRLSKLRLLQKLLDNLKCATISSEVIPTCKKAMSVLLKHLATTDGMRITALFVTSALQKVSHENTADALQDQNDGFVIGSLVLDAFTDYLCVASPVDGTERFAKTITNKWLLHLFDSADATTICSIIRIMVHLLITEGPRYSRNFEVRTRGYHIMRAKLSKWHVSPFVWAALFGLLFGIDVGPLDPSSFQLSVFFKTIAKRELVVTYPSAWYVLAGLFKQSSADFSSSAIASEQLTASLAFLQVLLKQSPSFALLAETSSFTRDIFHLLSSPGEEGMGHEQQNQTIATTAIARIEKREARLHKREVDDLAELHAVLEHESRGEPWRQNIYNAEKWRWQRARQDHQENDRFMQSRFCELDAHLVGVDLFEKPPEKTTCCVDNAEGFERRKVRLRPVQPSKVISYVPKRARAASTGFPGLVLRPTQSRSTSRTQATQAKCASDAKIAPPLPKGDSNEIVDDFEVLAQPQGAEYDVIDMNRKVMRSLSKGERILEVYNVTRIKGLEAVFSLLIVGKKSLYLLDNLFQKSDGEVVSADEAPKDEKDQYVVNILGVKADDVDTRAELSKTKSAIWADIINISKRRFLLRDVAIELFFVDGRSYLITTLTAASREILYTSLQSRSLSKADIPLTHKWRVDQFAMSDPKARSAGSRIFNLGPENPATAQWVRGELSNFQYLMLVNTMSGRTFMDLTQYPVFPWVLRDYSSDTLDLDDTSVYRDLSKPMGAQSPEREATYRERYEAFAEMNDSETPAFHYGTHYSSAMIVTSYLIRLEPFVRSYILQQGGAFDYPERLFDSIERTWLSASAETVSDVRELTPEFYFMPEFLLNVNGYDFGKKESTGKAVNNVELPPWAQEDPKIFIAKQREALESPYVSEHLHAWIDLVFGYKQQGSAAIEAANVFHHLSYHGAKDLDEIEDARQKLVYLHTIRYFGQTPRQVFQKPHPSRQTATEKVKPLATYFASLEQVREPMFKDAHSQISNLSLSLGTQRLTHSGPFQAHRPPKDHVYVEWGNTDGSLRFYKAGQLLDLFEALHTDHITVAAFADETTLITASLDCTITIWSVDGHSSGPFDVQFTAGLYGHLAAVNVLVVSRTLSTVLSSSTDGKVILWDLNSHERLRVLDNKERVDHAQIDHSSGHIILCSGMIATLYTINGDLILQQNLCAGLDDKISSCAFYATSSSEWLGGEYIMTGHTQGTAKIWKLANTPEGTWRLELVKTLAYGESSRPSTSLGSRLVSRSGRDRADKGPAARKAAITCVYAYNRRVFTGDDAGEVYEWTAR